MKAIIHDGQAFSVAVVIIPHEPDWFSQAMAVKGTPGQLRNWSGVRTIRPHLDQDYLIMHLVSNPSSVWTLWDCWRQTWGSLNPFIYPSSQYGDQWINNPFSLLFWVNSLIGIWYRWAKPRLLGLLEHRLFILITPSCRFDLRGEF